MTQRWAVHKFGGASVRDAAGVRNLSAILRQLAVGDDAGLGQAVVVSAMGKTTNALEAVWQALPQAADVEPVIAEVLADHRAVVQALGLPPDVLEPDVDRFREACEDWRGRPLSDEGYDVLVGFGERWSTRIVAAHLESEGMPAVWASAWSMVRTDAHHRAARVDLAATAEAIQRSAKAGRPNPHPARLCRGCGRGQPTTLGEGPISGGAVGGGAGGLSLLRVEGRAGCDDGRSPNVAGRRGAHRAGPRDRRIVGTGRRRGVASRYNGPIAPHGHSPACPQFHGTLCSGNVHPG